MGFFQTLLETPRISVPDAKVSVRAATRNVEAIRRVTGSCVVVADTEAFFLERRHHSSHSHVERSEGVVTRTNQERALV